MFESQRLFTLAAAASNVSYRKKRLLIALILSLLSFSVSPRSLRFSAFRYKTRNIDILLKTQRNFEKFGRIELHSVGLSVLHNPRMKYRESDFRDFGG